MASKLELERPRCCGECARWWQSRDFPNYGWCDNWAGVRLVKDAVCVPNMGRKKEAKDGK